MKNNFLNGTRLQDIVKKIRKIEISPVQVLVIGFSSLILLGTILLSFRVASADGESIGLVNALFEATSAVCVTGLVVVDTATELSTFGHVVILLLLQIGGLGIMTFATMIFLIMGKKISLKERLVIQESLNQFTLEGVVKLSRQILLITFSVELIGAILLSIRMIPMYGIGKGIWYSVFHSVSAFCNAGFDLMGNFSSFVGFVDDSLVNFTLITLIVLGGLGFSVMMNIWHVKFSFRKFSVHSKIVLIMSSALIVFGFVFFLLMEYNNPETLGNLTPEGKFWGALFQSVTPRTAGFNTISTADLTDSSKFMTIIYMFIGASPASTGGGIKTVTAFTVIIMVISVIRGKQEIVIFKREIPRKTGMRALAVVMINLIAIIVVTMILEINENFSFIDILFEVGSAIGTVGLASLNTPELSNVSKIALVFTMFMGRVGPLTIVYSLAQLRKRDDSNIKYPETVIMVG